MKMLCHSLNDKNQNTNSTEMTELCLIRNECNMCLVGDTNATYRLACRLLLLKDFNYNNLLEACNPVSQDCKDSTLLVHIQSSETWCYGTMFLLGPRLPTSIMDINYCFGY